MEILYENFPSLIIKDFPKVAAEKELDESEGGYLCAYSVGLEMSKQINSNDPEVERTISIINNYYVNGDHGVRACVWGEIYYEFFCSQFLFDFGKKNICPEAYDRLMKYGPIRYGGQGHP